MAALQQDDFDRSMELAERALECMRGHGTPALPPSYELFYTYATGKIVELNDAIDAIVADGKQLTEEDVARLYETYVTADRPEAKMEQVGGTLSAEIDQVLALIHSTNDSTEAFGESLKQVGAQLSRTTDPQQLKSVLQTLVVATKKMAENSHEMEGRLAESKQQISDLQKNLEKVRVESHTDPLTGVANRKQFDKTLEHSLDEAKRTGRPLCLLMVDIDHFKKFNDLYGHQTGDGVLKLVARAMKANVKGRDLLARYGGEEFVIILRNTGLQGACTLAEQIRRVVMGKELLRKSTGQNLGRITLSIGVASHKPEDTAQSFVHRADACLYAAKHLGRNCIKAESDPAVRKALSGPQAA